MVARALYTDHTMIQHACAIQLHTVFSVAVMRARMCSGLSASLSDKPLALDVETYEFAISYSTWSRNCTSVATAGT